MKTGRPRESRGYAVSPAIGPLPAIFVPGSPGQESPGGRSGRAPAGVVQALRSAARQLRRRAAAGRRRHRTGG
jgi:hypothetical protein